MPSVFITQIPSRLADGHWVPIVDVSPAKSFGVIKVVLPSGINAHAIDPGSDSEVALLDMCEDFRPEQDFLLPLGDTTLMVAAGAALARRCGKYQMLKWDRYTHKYFAFTVDTTAYASK